MQWIYWRFSNSFIAPGQFSLVRGEFHAARMFYGKRGEIPQLSLNCHDKSRDCVS
jgi:hypothetical protein